MTITIFALFVAYTLCCIADGPDVKPIIKRRLSKYLEVQANRLHPIQYVHPVMLSGNIKKVNNALRINEREVMEVMFRRGCTSDEAKAEIVNMAKKELAESYPATLVREGFMTFETHENFDGAIYVKSCLHVANFKRYEDTEIFP